MEIIIEIQHHNIMELHSTCYTIKRTALLLHFNKFIAQQLDHYLYTPNDQNYEESTTEQQKTKETKKEIINN